MTIQVRTDEDFTGIADSVPYAGGRGVTPLPLGSEKRVFWGRGDPPLWFRVFSGYIHFGNFEIFEI